MWQISIPWWEFLIRGSVIYLALFLLFRLGGKRQVGQLTPFDLILLLIISNGVQNAMIGPDTSIVGGLLVALVLFGWNQLFGFLSARSRKVERIIDGRPQVLVHHGHVYQDVLKQNQISLDELRAALRRSGHFELDDIEFAVLETNGAISVKERGPHDGESTSSK